MARVNVDQKALSDPRFAVLGQLMCELRTTSCARTSSTDKHALALGYMIRVWNECAERETQTLSRTVIAEIFQGYPNAADLLLTAELAATDYATRKPISATHVRIKGTAGRIEWLANRRREGKLGGRKGGRPPKTPRGLPPETPPAPAPAPAPALNTETAAPPPPAGGDAAVADFRAAWNSHPGLAPIRTMTPQRQRLLRDRLANPHWASSWRAA